MKKFVSLLLTMLLCFSVAAMAEEAAPSKTMDDLTKVEVEFENPLPGAEGVLIDPVANPTEEELVKYEEKLAAAEEELGKLESAESPVAYFGTLTDSDGNPTTILEQMGTKNVSVNEFFPIVVGNYQPEYGDAKLKIELPTEYDESEKLAALIGIVKRDEAGEQQVDWVIYSAKSVADEDGSKHVEVTLKPETLMAIQEGTGIMAIVNAPARAEFEHGDVEGVDGVLIYPVSEPTEEELIRYEEKLAAAEVEANKLSVAETPVAYFGTLKDPDGNYTTIAAQMGTENVVVKEIFPIVVGGYRQEMGDAKVDIEVYTQYTEGEKLVAIIGLATKNADGEQQMDWVAHPAECLMGADGKTYVRVVLKSEMLLAIQDGTGIVAIVSEGEL